MCAENGAMKAPVERDCRDDLTRHPTALQLLPATAAYGAVGAGAKRRAVGEAFGGADTATNDVGLTGLVQCAAN